MLTRECKAFFLPIGRLPNPQTNDMLYETLGETSIADVKNGVYQA
jgi:hypothetical protein